MLKGDLRVLLDLRAQVSESPVWDGDARRLYLVDINQGLILTHAWDSGRTTKVDCGEPVGSIALARDGELVAALRSSVALVDPATGSQLHLAAVAHARPDMRLNDGRCDPDGRCFWVGSMREALDEPAGVLYRVDPDGGVVQAADDLVCSNGLAFSPDGGTMYHSDSRRRTVYAYDYDRATGAATNRRVFCVAPEGEGRPDGAAVDAEGCYWSARYAGWRVVRHAPDGSELFTLRVPVENPTMCAFAGDDLATLVITSARGSLTEDQLRAQPHAGSVFAVEVAVRGVAEGRFGAGG
ncbi:MAG: SMP-30/gluconolactonase/LRE family protein [Proteobacteria bacterium]|nr:SMP-30/gluconolactonase/LRE family protein [Pseudomonadota bacterium]